jgi:hypothetical protein
VKQIKALFVSLSITSFILFFPNLVASLGACLFGLQLNEKQLELVESEKQLELDSW